MSDEERTLGEIGRALDALIVEVRDLPAKLEQTYVRQDVYSADKTAASSERESLVRRVTALESRSEWVIRTVGALIIAAIIAGILVTRP